MVASAEALWSNCKRTQSSEWRVFLCIAAIKRWWECMSVDHSAWETDTVWSQTLMRSYVHSCVLIDSPRKMNCCSARCAFKRASARTFQRDTATGPRRTAPVQSTKFLYNSAQVAQIIWTLWCARGMFPLYAIMRAKPSKKNVPAVRLPCTPCARLQELCARGTGSVRTRHKSSAHQCARDTCARAEEVLCARVANLPRTNALGIPVRARNRYCAHASQIFRAAAPVRSGYLCARGTVENWFMLSVRLSSYGCTREVGSAREKRKSCTRRSLASRVVDVQSWPKLWATLPFMPNSDFCLLFFWQDHKCRWKIVAK